MTQLKLTSALAVTLALLISLQSNRVEARDRADRRQGRQAARIQDGRKDGQITAREQHRLNESRRVVRRNERRAEKDGVVTEKEAAKLETLQDARSHQIERLKTNDKEKSGTP